MEEIRFLEIDWLCFNTEGSRFIVDHRLSAKPDGMGNTKGKKACKMKRELLV